MFENFEDDCRAALVEARKEAQRLGLNFIDAEHLLLGLLRVPASTAVRMLQALGLDIGAISTRITTLLAPLNNEGQPLIMTLRLQRVLDLATKEAGSLGDRYVGTEHLLLGCVLEAEQSFKGKLNLVGTSAKELRSVLDKVLRGEQAPSNRGKPLPPDPIEPHVEGSPAQRLSYAAVVCEGAKFLLIQDHQFERAARTHELGDKLRALARELVDSPAP